MGLDLCVEGRPRPGFEDEWEAAIRKAFADEDFTDAEIDRFQQISEPGYAVLGAPQVGKDEAANDWIAEQKQGELSREEAIREFEGYHVLALVQCDGLPMYSHAGLYEGVDETSFRGKFLEVCVNVIPDTVIDQAWEHRMPDDATRYGRTLLEYATAAHNGKTIPVRKRSLLGRLLGKPADTVPLQDQIDIVEAAGKWFIFWGERGHPIRAYF